jgi:hypothetical protein
MFPHWLVKGLSKLISSLQVFPYPLFVIWGPTSYKVKGHHARKVLDNLQTGDIILRRYDRYVSPWFIPGWWKHVGIYIGDNKVIHATTEGVIEEDILTYLRCDYVAVMRVPEAYEKLALTEIPERAKSHLGKPYDFAFETHDAKRFYCTELVRTCFFDYYDIKFNIKETGFIGKGAVLPDYLMDSGFELVYSSVAEQK